MGCQLTEDCQLDSNTTLMTVRFNHSIANEFTWDSVKNDLIDSIFFDSSVTGVIFQLPLTEAEDSITYRFFTDSMDFFLTVNYRAEANVFGIDCPSSFQFSELTTGQTSFDRIEVSNSTLDRRIPENLEVFF